MVARSLLVAVRALGATEVELINGSLVREAERFGVDVPLHRTVYALVRGKEASYT